MLFDLEVILEDKPKTLVQMLTPISECDCNIQGIYHGQKREKDNYIPVHIRFEAADKNTREVMNFINKKLDELKIQVTKFTPYSINYKRATQERKAVLIILDGATDVQLPDLNARTPLEVAKIPTLDNMAEEGICGTFHALGPSVLVGSDTAILSILGYDPYKVYTGRGPLEAAGTGLDLQPGDVSLRCNYVTISDDFKILNRTAGYPRQGTALLEEAINRIKLTDSKVEFEFRNSQDYRCVVRFRGYNISANISDMDPNYNVIADPLDNIDLLDKGESKIITSKPLRPTPEAKNMANILNEFVKKSHEALKDLPFNKDRKSKGLPQANCLLPRGAGETPFLTSFRSKWGIKGGCVAGTGLIRGICKLAGMVVPEVPGATGYIDTDYLAKAQFAVNLIHNSCDFVIVHVEGIDEATHDKDSKAKIGAIENSSEILIRHIVDNVPSDTIICVLSDHTTSCLSGDHTLDPTGVMFWSKEPMFRKDNTLKFCESEFPKGILVKTEGKDIMPLLMGYMHRLDKFGA